MFRAEAQGKELHFENAGVIGGNEVFRDRESGSRWQQSSLEAISGPMKGEHVKLYPFLLTNWGEWRKLHPDTLVLKRHRDLDGVFRGAIWVRRAVLAVLTVFCVAGLLTEKVGGPSGEGPFQSVRI